MKKKTNFVIAALAAAAFCLALTACSAGGAEVIQVSGDTAALPHTITVTGRDSVMIQPDMAEMVFAVETDDEDPIKCQQDNSAVLDKVLAFLGKQGLSETSIKTSGYNLSDNYGWVDGDWTYIGYEMTTRITVSDVPIDKAGAILAGTVSAGATAVRSVSYYSSEYDAAYDKALTKAVNQARDKAETLAEAGGNVLGNVIQIEEYSDSQSGRYVSSNVSIDALSVFGNGDGDDDMTLMAGEMEVSADVKVVFECE